MRPLTPHEDQARGMLGSLVASSTMLQTRFQIQEWEADDVRTALAWLHDRNPWYAEVSAAELAELSGPNRAKWQGRHGAEFIDHQIEIWTAMQPVMTSGEHCPHHIRGRKPT